MSRVIRLGSRRSALARVQAHHVGQALQALEPALRIDYHFIEASGDRSADPDAGRVTARGGFTEDLGRMLDRGDIDLAVHSWKDLPLGARAATQVVATLPRADARDVLLLRHDAAERATTHGITVLSSSARRRRHIEEFLGWALPLQPASVRFAPVRGDIETRLRKLLRGEGDALIIAKAAIDRLLESTPEALEAIGQDSADRLRGAQATVRDALERCRALILPLACCPAAPAQAALALEVRADTPLLPLWQAVNHQDSFDTVQAERAAAALVPADAPFGITRLRFDYGDVEFQRAGDEHVAEIRMLRSGAGLPRPASTAAICLGVEPSAPRRLRLPVATVRSRFDAAHGLLVARAEALLEDASVDARSILWTPGLSTWRKLAARGHWVVGSDEGLGETGAASIRHWYPHVRRWVKLSHEAGHSLDQAEFVATYRRERGGAYIDVNRYTHFFWRSGSQLREYLLRFPSLTSAWHGCSPGNSWRIARTLLDPARLRPFLGAEQFRAELSG